jgi:hypothetical protein
MDIFNLLFDEQICALIVDETNKQAEIVFCNEGRPNMLEYRVGGQLQRTNSKFFWVYFSIWGPFSCHDWKTTGKPIDFLTL